MIKISPEKLKEILVNEGLVSSENFDKYATEADRLNQQLGDVLISKGIISYDYFYAIVAKYFGVELAYLKGVNIDENILNLLSLDIARQKRAIVFNEEQPGGLLDVAMEDPSDLQTVEFLEAHLKGKLKYF